MAKKEKRFKVKEEEGLGFGAIQIIVDRVTGVNYVAVGGVNPTGITPLLDQDGRIVIDEIGISER